MQRRHAFTLIEALTVIVIIAVLIGIMLPALAATQSEKHKKQNNTNLREIHVALNIFANRQTMCTSEGHFAGLDHDHTIWSKSEPKTTVGNIKTEGGDGADPVTRYAILLDDNLIKGEQLIAPIDSKTAWQAGQTLSTLNYSYAMLSIVDTPTSRFNPEQGNTRRKEWAETLSDESPVMADRNTSDGHVNWSANQATASIWSEPADEKNEHFWKGSIVWNDNRVVFSMTDRVRTRYGSHTHKHDYIFDTETGPALMVYSDSTSPGLQH